MFCRNVLYNFIYMKVLPECSSIIWQEYSIFNIHWYISFICTRPFDRNIWSSFFHLFFLCAQPFDKKLGSSLIYFLYLYTSIPPNLGTLNCYLIYYFLSCVSISFLQYCHYFSSAIIIPYFIHYIHGRAALIVHLP